MSRDDKKEPTHADSVLDSLIHEKQPHEEQVKKALPDEGKVFSLFERMKSIGVWNQALVNIVSYLYPQKKVQKELKRLAYLFSQKGVKTFVPQEDQATPLSTSMPSPVVKEAWSSLPMDYTRIRLGVLKISKSFYIFAQLSPHVGIQYIGEGTEEGLKRLKRTIKEPLLKVPVDYLTFIISLAKEKTKDPQILTKLRDLEREAKIEGLLHESRSFEFSEPFDDSLIENSPIALVDLSKELIKLIYGQDLLEGYLERYKAAANPRIILSKFLIETRKMEVIEEFVKEILRRKEDFILALKEDIFLSKLAQKDVSPSKNILLKLFLKDDVGLLTKAIELILEAPTLHEQPSTSKIIMP